MRFNQVDNRPEKLSVILSTYNAPLWLQKTVWGYAGQRFREFEIVIADDGSTSETAAVIDDLRADTGLSIHHVWHDDDGFRKCTILNRAIEASRGDYLVFSDGDCIPRKDFLSHHYEHAQHGRFLSGGYFKLPMSTSQAIDKQSILSGSAFRKDWLYKHGLEKSHRSIRLVSRGWVAHTLNFLTTTKPTWNGHNASGWKSDLLAAGGFDTRMRYGGEDRELGERLENRGIRGKHIRYQALCLHLDHARGYVNDEDLQQNRQIRDETRLQRRTQTEYGIPLIRDAA